ncbi:hypothetical protein AAFH68_12330 [Flavobacterium sp. CGRL1]
MQPIRITLFQMHEMHLNGIKKLYEVQGNNLTDIYYLRYIQSMKAVMDYDEADRVTKEYLDKKGDKKEISRYVAQKKQLDSLAKAKIALSD